MALLGAIGYGGMSAAWQMQRYSPSLNAARGISSASAVSKQKSTLTPAGAAAAGTAASAAPGARELPYIPKGYGPVELATRTRIRFPGLGLAKEDSGESLARRPLTKADGEDAYPIRLPGAKSDDEDQTGFIPGAKKDDETAKSVLPGAKNEEKYEYLLPGMKKDGEDEEFRLPGTKKEEDDPAIPGVKDAKSPAQVMNEAKCQTCAKRKYQDGSDDPGVSFKTAQHIDPKMAASRVRGHEMEHVVRERAEAKREGRKVVSQSVTYHTGICPECGKFYVSGGTTRTVTANDNSKDLVSEMAERVKRNLGLDITA